LTAFWFEGDELSASILFPGNDSFKRKQWGKAIEFYSDALELNCTNGTYYCNRAAAYLELAGILSIIRFDHSCLKSALRSYSLCPFLIDAT
jgi:hypothetical protein